MANDLPSDLAKLNVRHRTAHYAIAGTAADERLKEYGRCLEYIYREYAVGFEGLLAPAPNGKGKAAKQRGGSQPDPASTRGEDPVSPPAPADPEPPDPPKLPGLDGGRFPVIIFGTDRDYADFSTKYFSGALEHTLGAYMPNLKLLVIRDDPNSSETYQVLFHEAFHQFAHEYVPLIPIWLNEGLATYYGSARVTPDGLRFDRYDDLRFALVRSAAEQGRMIPLRDLTLMDQRAFYARAQLCYAEAYTLVAYILHDPLGPKKLQEYLKALAKAEDVKDVPAITRGVFDQRLLDAMTPQWLAFCKGK